jgi:hypothetical protein
VNDPGFAVTLEERRRLLEANESAVRYFRQELLQASDGWPVEYLKNARVEQVLFADSEWRVGYAPDTSTGLVEHLRAEHFAYSTMARAGLVTRSDDGEIVDRYRDRLVLVARNAQLSVAGFVGIGRDGTAETLNPATTTHQPSNALVGVKEQLDLLRGGAIPVVVDHPVDAIAVSSMSRQMDGQWAGIPVCGPGLSTAQTRMLRKFSMSDQVIVILSGDEYRQKLTAGYLADLTMHYDRIRAVVMPWTASTLLSTEGGHQVMTDLLTTAPPTYSYRLGGAGADLRDPEPPDQGPEL